MSNKKKGLTLALNEIVDNLSVEERERVAKELEIKRTKRF